MRFRHPVTAILLAAAAVADAQSVDTPPSTPGDLVARAYGPTSGGVVWQRSVDDRGVRGYEVSRDGTVLGVRDALSYVADDLQPGRRYDIAVVAIDSAGQRSGRALARIVTPDARPDRPGGLSAGVYSTTAAGIRWDRAGVFGERYEVRRDGETVADMTDATSYVDTTLSPRRPYLFEVIAINRQGERSAAARLFVDTSNDSSPPRSASPDAPNGLRAVVYSATAGAVAWERSPVPGLRHEVARDGKVVASTDGTSYVDTGLAGGRAYDYRVIAIDRDGRRSAPSRVTLTTPGDRPPPVPGTPFAAPDPAGATAIARLGYPDALELAGELLSAAYLDLYFEADVAVQELVGTDGAERVVDCPGGGSASGTGFGPAAFVDLELDGCAVAGRTLSGGLVREVSRFPIATGQVAELRIDFDDLRIDAGADGTLRVSGSFSSSLGSGRNARCNRYETASETVRIDSARLERGGEVTLVSAASYTQRDDTRDFGDPNDDVTPCITTRTITLDGEASLVATRFGASAATLTLDAELVDRGDENTRRGVLEADFGDGSTLAVTTTSGSDEEVQVDIVSDAAVVSFVDDHVFGKRAYAVPPF